ncbi:replication protein A 70 kDa DNA-binding subunit D [Artemisia annua]|uniref:Replication protein A 70 kDa DNA-binding subunit D n=1 Tax=Artemisia annua TaxID=35608 RepID=A0A2U1MAP8_ARTAN|nr:replication protein A 70 kDa DNA-binding subunit D [Artemisia annua]
MLQDSTNDPSTIKSTLEVDAKGSKLKPNDTKKGSISDVELLNVEDLKTNAKNTKLDVHILEVMKEKDWWDKWEWDHCVALEDEYEDDHCYCSACQQTYEITNNEECSTIKVKIIHIWKTTSTLWVSSSKGENINMLLMDEKGNKIHACANHYVLKLCQPMLKKDNYILLSNFNLYTGLEGMQLTNHVGKIYFKNNTSISVVQDFNCAHDGFEFIEYHDIITDEKYNKLAFDIIGLISSKPKLKAIYYRKKTTIISEFKLQNLNGDEVNVTLWEDNADKLDNYLSQEYIQNEPVVLVIQLAKINTWGNEHEVSTIPFCTKVIINENIPAITSFKRRLLDKKICNTKSRIVDQDDSIANEAQYSESAPIDAGDLSTVKHGNACDVTVINISVDEDEAQCSESAPIDDGDLSTVKHGNACDVTVINISVDEDEAQCSESAPIDDGDLSIVKHGNACDVTVINISDDEDEIYAAGLNGYRSTPILKKPKQNEQYAYNISDDDIDLHDTDNEVGCFAGTSHGFSKSTFQRGKNTCKLDDYFEYEIDGGYGFTSEEASFKDDVSEQLKLDMDSLNGKKTNHTYDADYIIQHNCTWWNHNAHENEDMVVYAPFHPNIGYYYQLRLSRVY